MSYLSRTFLDIVEEMSSYNANRLRPAQTAQWVKTLLEPTKIGRKLLSDRELNELIEEHTHLYKYDPAKSYEISTKSKLGLGGTCRVFLIQRKYDRKKFALRFARDSYKKDSAQTVEQFKTEVFLQSYCRHENICQVYDACHYIDRFWMIVEYLPGNSLTQICQKAKGRLTEEFIKYSLLQTLKAINYLH